MLKILDQILIIKKMIEDFRMIFITMTLEEKAHNSFMMIISEIKSILKTITKTTGIHLKTIKKSGGMIKIEDMKKNLIIIVMNKIIRNIQDGKKMVSKYKNKAS